MKRMYLPIFGMVFILGSCPLTDIVSRETSGGGVTESSQAAITGFVWNDECKVPNEFTGEVPAGCIENSFDTPNFGPLVANGILDMGEAGMVGVMVDLGQGALPFHWLQSGLY